MKTVIEYLFATVIITGPFWASWAYYFLTGNILVF